ncbi:sterol carrier protein 2 [Homo sapiens]|uniref:Isoform 3 of Sterol carrier protein 2 n=1 Tax=Homo sapiens TaxID=9606 RepID=P22307-3|eukprot:NP_001007099.1 non-specific lipid-transfer protein isoform 2 [Homo sapiens]
MSSSPWEPATLRRVFVVGVGMTKFVKPGAENSRDYPDLAEEAGKKALADAQIPYSAVDQACVGYVFGVAECVLALGFEKMSKGSLGIKFSDRTIPTDKHVDLLINKYGLSAHPVAPQMFGYAGKEHMEKYGTKIEHFAKIGWKNHKHSVNNPYSQFQDEYSLDEVMASKEVFDFLTILQCCPTSDGAAAAILASEAFVQKYGLQSKAVEILAQEMMTDLPSSFEEKSIIKMVGFDMSKEAARKCYEKSGLTPNDIDVIELHDCFSTNELLTYEALGLCPEGQGATLVDRGDNTYGGKWVINPSGGLISKGHPLGATGGHSCS